MCWEHEFNIFPKITQGAKIQIPCLGGGTQTNYSFIHLFVCFLLLLFAEVRIILSARIFANPEKSIIHLCILKTLTMYFQKTLMPVLTLAPDYLPRLEVDFIRSR